jgi:hypothetical protein
VEFDPADDDTVYAGAFPAPGGFVNRSTNGGATWRIVASASITPAAF